MILSNLCRCMLFRFSCVYTSFYLLYFIILFSSIDVLHLYESFEFFFMIIVTIKLN